MPFATFQVRYFYPSAQAHMVKHWRTSRAILDHYFEQIASLIRVNISILIRSFFSHLVSSVIITLQRNAGVIDFLQV